MLLCNCHLAGEPKNPGRRSHGPIKFDKINLNMGCIMEGTGVSGDGSEFIIFNSVL